MRHQLGVGALLVAAFCAPVAMADIADATTYTINFVGTGTLPTVGLFTYDPDIASFSNFSVTWIGLTFDLTGSANAPSQSPTIPTCLSGKSGGAASFALLSGVCKGAFWSATSSEIITANFSFVIQEGNNFLEVFKNDTIPFNFQPMTAAEGSWTIHAAPVPEPCSLIFLAASLVPLALLARKRNSVVGSGAPSRSCTESDWLGTGTQ